MRHQNPDKFQFKFSVILCLQRLLWHPRKLASSKQSYSQNSRDETKDEEYNRRAAIIEDFRTGRSAMEIIRFFGYPKSIVYDVEYGFRSNEDSNMPAYEESFERTHREDPRSR